MNRILSSLIIVLALVLIVYAIHTELTGYFVSRYENVLQDPVPPIAEMEKAFVTRVIDGDTIVIEGGERVRLLGINTPEKGQHLYKQSTQFLKELVENKTVYLEKDETNRDKYDRLLRHVYLDNMHVNLELVKTGLAKTLIILPSKKHSEVLLEAENMARQQNLGIWPHNDIEYAFCIGISRFQYNAKGNDNENLNGEYVTFRNFCYYSLDLSGWTLNDERGTTFTFPDFIIQNKTRFTVYTGPGESKKNKLYWNNSMAIWNNNGDTLRLWDSEGNLMLEYAY